MTPENYFYATLGPGFEPVPCTYEAWVDSIDPRLHPKHQPTLKRVRIDDWTVELTFTGVSVTNEGPRFFQVEVHHPHHMRLGSRWETYPDALHAFDAALENCRVEAMEEVDDPESTEEGFE